MQNRNNFFLYFFICSIPIRTIKKKIRFSHPWFAKSWIHLMKTSLTQRRKTRYICAVYLWGHWSIDNFDVDSAGNNSWSSDIVRPKFENVRPICVTLWLDMMTRHLISTSWVISSGMRTFRTLLDLDSDWLMGKWSILIGREQISRD